MNVTGLVDPAGAGATDRWVRSSDMDQLISRKNRDMLHFDEIEWRNVFRQDRRVLKGTGTQGKDRNEKAFDTATIIGVVYVGVLIVLMLVFLT
jgi:hypothetical protein